jgi:hypothetical protein
MRDLRRRHGAAHEERVVNVHTGQIDVLQRQTLHRQPGEAAAFQVVGQLFG